jgi:dolichol-phosphate mannosyltransferase
MVDTIVAPRSDFKELVIKPIELAIVVPSFNELDNVELLINRLTEALRGIEWEVIYVDDDSPDGTAAKVREIAQVNARVRCLQRIGRRGLSSAVIEGMLATSAPHIAVIDADLQHDETLLPSMFDTIRSEDLDVVIGSRYVAGGAIGEWDERRAAMSNMATRLARLIVSAELTDPMSGFFMIRRPALDRAVRRLSGQGFKVLLDLFASTQEPYRFKELPYTFGTRLHGESKLDSLVVWEYLMLLLDKLIGRWVPVRFVLFSVVGAFGLIVHLTTLRIALIFLDFAAAQGLATVVAMTSNFVINNVLTYRDKRLRGMKFAVGLLSFYAICSVGAVANVGVAATAFRWHYVWWVSGIAGACVSVVWNYAVTSIFTWRTK